MTQRSRPTPPGTWPLLISGVLFLLTVPGILLGQVIPQWLAIAGAALFLLVAAGALLWSYLVFRDVRATPERGAPIAGLAVGLIVVVLAALVVLPTAIAG